MRLTIYLIYLNIGIILGLSLIGLVIYCICSFICCRNRNVRNDEDRLMQHDVMMYRTGPVMPISPFCWPQGPVQFPFFNQMPGVPAFQGFNYPQPSPQNQHNQNQQEQNPFGQNIHFAEVPSEQP